MLFSYFGPKNFSRIHLFIKANLDSRVAQELNILGTAVHAMTTKICNMYVVQSTYAAGNCKVDVELTLQDCRT